MLAHSRRAHVLQVDYCLLFDRSMCKSYKAKKFLGCKWNQRNAPYGCSVKASFVQPAPLECEGDCCVLNKAACQGKTWKSKAWKKSHGRGGPTKACKFTPDRTFTSTTPDGKSFGACMPKMW